MRRKDCCISSKKGNKNHSKTFFPFLLQSALNAKSSSSAFHETVSDADVKAFYTFPKTYSGASLALFFSRRILVETATAGLPPTRKRPNSCPSPSRAYIIYMQMTEGWTIESPKTVIQIKANTMPSD